MIADIYQAFLEKSWLVWLLGSYLIQNCVHIYIVTGRKCNPS